LCGEDFFFQAEDGIRDRNVTGGQTCALPISSVTRADLAAYSMTTKISEELKSTTSASADLAEAVRKRGHVRIDTGKLTEHAVKRSEERRVGKEGRYRWGGAG